MELRADREIKNMNYRNFGVFHYRKSDKYGRLSLGATSARVAGDTWGLVSSQLQKDTPLGSSGTYLPVEEIYKYGKSYI